MRLHSDIITPADVESAARRAGVSTFRNGRHGSRIRSGAVDFILQSERGGPGNSGRYGATSDYLSASWDSWGDVLGELFRLDPAAIVPNVYLSGEHYAWSTGGRFDGQHYAAHPRHRWQYDGASATGSYYVQSCKCGALKRYMAHGRDFAEISEG